jgi:hypothetical protein
MIRFEKDKGRTTHCPICRKNIVEHLIIEKKYTGLEQPVDMEMPPLVKAPSKLSDIFAD